MKFRYYLFQISEKLEIILYLASLAMVLFGCSPESRFNRLVKNHPHLKATDTVSKTDSIFIPGTTSEKTFPLVIRDTVIIREGNLIQKFYYSDSTVYLYGQCKADTIVRVVKIPVDKFNTLPEPVPKWLYIALLGLNSLILILVLWQRR